MCLGVPMQIVTAAQGIARCVNAAGESRQVRTALVGELGEGEWVLVFRDDAVEHIDAQRAREVQATLDLVRSAMAGGEADAAAAFELPSAMSQAALRQLTD